MKPSFTCHEREQRLDVIVVLFVIVLGVITLAKVSEEVKEEGSVEILAELVEDKPVPEAALAEVGPDLGHPAVGPLEVTVHPGIENIGNDGKKGQLKEREGSTWGQEGSMALQHGITLLFGFANIYKR